MCLCHSSSLGVAAITATIGIVVAIIAALIGVIWFPVKRQFISKSKKTTKV